MNNDIKLTLVSARRRQALYEEWRPRIGHDGADTLVRSYARIRLGLALALLGLVASLIIGVSVRYGVGMTVEVFLVTPVALAVLVSSGRLKSRARRQAGAFLALPQSSWPIVPVRDSEHFDRWFAARNNPGWPKRIGVARL